MGILEAIITGYVVNIVFFVCGFILMFILSLTEVVKNEGNLSIDIMEIMELSEANREKRKQVTFFQRAQPIQYAFLFPFMQVISTLYLLYLVFHFKSVHVATHASLVADGERLDNIINN